MEDLMVVWCSEQDEACSNAHGMRLVKSNFYTCAESLSSVGPASTSRVT